MVLSDGVIRQQTIKEKISPRNSWEDFIIRLYSEIYFCSHLRKELILSKIHRELRSEMTILLWSEPYFRSGHSEML